jgi:archaellum component FlaG (FlaF/FlaG flagellin family)
MKITYFFISILLLASCGAENSTKKDGKLVSTVVANDENEAELKKELSAVEKEEQERLVNEASALTTMEFDKLEHDFGKVKEDSDNKTVFYVKNTGEKPLIIEGVSASCGCTTPSKPEQPIQPGKKDKIEVVFHPKIGQLKEQNKTVTVTANTDPKMVVLNVKAFVEEKNNK